MTIHTIGWLSPYSRTELAEAIARSGMDISPCMNCGLRVVCIPDGLPMCEACANGQSYCAKCRELEEA